MNRISVRARLNLLMVVIVALAVSVFPATAKPVSASGYCFSVVRTAAPVGTEGKYLGMWGGYQSGTSEITMSMYKTDPNNDKFTNKGVYWVQARASGTEEWSEVYGSRRNYDGTYGTPPSQLTTKFLMGYAPKGNSVQMRFVLKSDNDRNTLKYSNRLIVKNRCL